MKKLENNLKYKYQFSFEYKDIKIPFYLYLFENLDSIEVYIQADGYGVIDLLYGLPVPFYTKKLVDDIIQLNDGLKQDCIIYLCNHAPEWYTDDLYDNLELIKIY